jgi:outer membrane protein assembly factor BamE (lipoprotein component of BamABCDE complex)
MMTTKAKSCATVLLIALAAVSSTGCATHDRRDTAYDPKISQGQSLFDQMPNWQQQCGVTVKCQ